MFKWMVMAKRADFKAIAEKYGIDQVTARLLRNRDVIGDEAIETWLHGTLEDIRDPHEIGEIDKAADIIAASIRAGERIRIIGDYDVDGICSTYILYRGLLAAGAKNPDYMLPDRISDGYGLNENLIRRATEDSIDLILTCDNGIRAIDEITLANELGIRVVVTDHHESKKDADGREILPDAAAVVDPKKEGDPCTFSSICGAVVAYKFLQVLFERIPVAEADALFEEFLVFAAFATNCDVMPLVDENRILMKEGLRRIAACPNKGLLALIRSCRLDPQALRASDFGFYLGPKLNATGRLSTAARALELLMAQTEEDAVRIAGDLDALNEERKELEARGVDKANAVYEEKGYDRDKILVIYLPDIHESLAGIIAGRIRERYDKPAIILTDAAEEGLVKGSGRAVPQYDMYAGLSATEDLFLRFGGHEQAAGLTLKKEHIDTLRSRLNADCTLSETDLEQTLRIDMEMPMSYATEELARQFEILEPCGKGNPRPLFAARDMLLLNGRIIGRNHNVGKYQVADAAGRKYDIICFKGLERFNDFLRDKFGADGLNDIYDGYRPKNEYRFHMAYHVGINVYQGRESLQVELRDYL